NDTGEWRAAEQVRLMAKACHRAKIKPAISFHVLRHTHGSMLAMRGVPMAVIAEQLGHADTRMTEKHYAHLAPNYVAATIRTHFPILGIARDVTVLPMERKADQRPDRDPGSDLAENSRPQLTALTALRSPADKS